MKTIGRVEVETVIDVRCDVYGASTRVDMGGFQFGSLQANGASALPTTVSVTKYISVRAAFFKHWHIFDKSGEFRICSVRTTALIYRRI